MLSKVTLDDNSYFSFDYTSYGQVKKISHYAPEIPNQPSHLLASTAYDLSIDAGQTDCPRFTTRTDYAENWSTVNTSFTFDRGTGFGKVTLPDGTVVKETHSVLGFKKGLTTQVDTYSSDKLTTAKKTVAVTWTQDATSLPYPQNPRVTDTTVTDDSGNQRYSTINYSSLTLPNSGTVCNLPSDVKEYDSAGTTVLRKTHTDYITGSAYLNQHIIGLASARYLYDSDSQTATPLSKVTFGYDASNSLSSQGEPVQHDSAYSTSFLTRGNLTSVTRWDVSTLGSQTPSSVTSTLGYNTAGDLISSGDPLSHTLTISYNDSFATTLTAHSGSTLAYPTSVTDPDNYSSTAQYDFDLGVAKVTTNPKGATLTRTFDFAGRVTKVESNLADTNDNKASTRFVYPTSMTEVDTFVLQSVTVDATTGTSTAAEIYSAQFLDGAGRVIGALRKLPGSTGGYSGQKFVYDVMGRMSQQFNPTEISDPTGLAVANWTAAGDDATAGWLYTTQTYDWKGRPRITTNTDSTTRSVTYGGCGCAGGEVVTTQDEVLRKQKMTYDVLGRLAKTEVLNSDGTVYSTVANTYNARDQVTLIRQYQGDATSATYQDTTMTYDGHGRLQSRHLPAQFDHSLPVSSAFDYYADDLLQKETDPRAASSTYTYNGRHLVTGITYAKPASSNPSSPDQIETIPNVDPVAFGYDEAGNRTSMTDGLGQTTYTYDTWSRLGTETRTFTAITGNSPLQYTYNLAGELTSLTDAFGQKVDYLYDQAGELTTAKIGSVNYLSGIKYRAWGAPKQVDTGNNLRESMAYNSRLQVTQFDVRSGGGTGAIVMGYSYRYDFDGQTANNNDGRVRFAQDLTLTNSPLDRSYSYDHAGRLTSGSSGSEANRQQPPPTPTGPYYHTFGFDAFDNLTSRGGRNGYVPGSTPISYSTSYTNNRNSAWSYNLAGDVTDADQQHFLWDAAGQNSQITTIVNGATTMIWYLAYDGDKHNVLRTTDDQHGAVTTTYSIRSSVLGGQVTNEMNASGLQQKTYIYANGRRIARQKNGSTYWLSEDPANLTNIETDSSGAIFARVQLDALGVITATGSGGGIPPSGSFNFQAYYGNPVSPIDGCRLDGAPFPCDWLARLVSSGSAVQCPNNDCGPRPSLDKNGVPIPGVFEVFNATANGYMPFNAIYDGNGYWSYPGSEYAHRVSSVGGDLPTGSFNWATEGEQLSPCLRDALREFFPQQSAQGKTYSPIDDARFRSGIPGWVNVLADVIPGAVTPAAITLGLYDIHYDPKNVNITGGSVESLETVIEEVSHAGQFINVWAHLGKNPVVGGKYGIDTTSYSFAQTAWKEDYVYYSLKGGGYDNDLERKAKDNVRSIMNNLRLHAEPNQSQICGFDLYPKSR